MTPQTLVMYAVIGAMHVVGVAMPSAVSSQHSLDDAKDLCARIGADYRSDVAALETSLRGLWQRRPWKES